LEVSAEKNVEGSGRGGAKEETDVAGAGADVVPRTDADDEAE